MGWDLSRIIASMNPRGSASGARQSGSPSAPSRKAKFVRACPGSPCFSIKTAKASSLRARIPGRLEEPVMRFISRAASMKFPQMPRGSRRISRAMALRRSYQRRSAYPKMSIFPKMGRRGRPWKPLRGTRFFSAFRRRMKSRIADCCFTDRESSFFPRPFAMHCPIFLEPWMKTTSSR
jgi:hypothetical protein